MSCWVVPSVAAEFWGVSLDAIWTRVYAGQVPHKRDGGFVFVDVAPWSADFKGLIRHEPPPTYTFEADAALEPQEVALLTCTQEPAEQGGPEQDTPEEDLPLLEEEGPAALSRFGWQETRERVARTRIPPGAQKNT